MAVQGDPTASYRFRDEQEASMWRAGLDRKIDRLVNLVDALSGDMREMRLRVTTLEQAPAQHRSAWSFGFTGCQTTLMALGFCVSFGGFLMAVGALIVAIVK